MSQPDTLLVDLPSIFRSVAFNAPLPSMQRPYLQDGYVCAVNACVAVEMPAELFRDDVLAKLNKRPCGAPDVDRMIQRWKGDGASHRLPGWDDTSTHGARSSVRVGWTPLMRKWVAFLLVHGIRVVHTGITPDVAVRFDLPGLPGEGLLLPCLERPRAKLHHYKKGF